MSYPDEFWSKRYLEGNTGWDIGYVSTPIKAYVDQLGDKSVKILIPGCGNAYEAEYLLEQGFENVTLLDISRVLVEKLRKKLLPAYEDQLRILHQDFFDHDDKYDLILEQTFFCALPPDYRPAYAQKTYELLKDGGTLAGVLFKFPLTDDGPPFGGSRDEYLQYFEPLFDVGIMEESYNSIAPRQGNELFFILRKR